MTCAGDAIDGCSSGVWSLEGVADPLHDVTKSMVPIKKTTQNAWTGLLLADRSILHLIDFCDLNRRKLKRLINTCLWPNTAPITVISYAVS